MRSSSLLKRIKDGLLLDRQGHDWWSGVILWSSDKSHASHFVTILHTKAFSRIILLITMLRNRYKDLLPILPFRILFYLLLVCMPFNLRRYFSCRLGQVSTPEEVFNFTLPTRCGKIR